MSPCLSQLDRRSVRLVDGPYRIGVDEITYKRGRRYLTIVPAHDTGRVVWVGKHRSQAAFNDFFDALGRRAEKVAAISLDASSIHKTVAAERILQILPLHGEVWIGPHLPVGDAEAQRLVEVGDDVNAATGQQRDGHLVGHPAFLLDDEAQRTRETAGPPQRSRNT